MTCVPAQSSMALILSVTFLPYLCFAVAADDLSRTAQAIGGFSLVDLWVGPQRWLISCDDQYSDQPSSIRICSYMLHIPFLLHATTPNLNNTSFLQLAHKLIDILDLTTSLSLGWIGNGDSLQTWALFISSFLPGSDEIRGGRGMGERRGDARNQDLDLLV